MEMIFKESGTMSYRKVDVDDTFIKQKGDNNWLSADNAEGQFCLYYPRAIFVHQNMVGYAVIFWLN